MSDVSSFVQSNLPYAIATSQATGLPVDYILGQSGLESGWGSSPAAQTQNNYFGISPGGSLASYGSVGASFQAFANLINGGRYSGWPSAGGTAQQIGDYINGQGYSQTPDYGSRVQGATNAVDSVLQQLGLGSYATSGGTPSGTAGPGSSGSSGSSSGCSWCAQIENWFAAQVGNGLSSGVFVVLGLVLLLGALLAFANDQGWLKNVPLVLAE